MSDDVLEPRFVLACERAGVDPQRTQDRMIAAAYGRVSAELPRNGVVAMVRHLIATEALVNKQRGGGPEERDKLGEPTIYWGKALLEAKRAGYPPEECERIAMYSTWLFAASRALHVYIGLDLKESARLGKPIAEAAWEARAQAVKEAQTRRPR